MKLVIITGLSGAGKSQTIKYFEDLGYFCIDNLPVMLIEKFIEICSKTEKTIDKVALVIDIRAGEFLDSFCNVLENLEHVGFGYDIVFLEAQDKVIIRRYSTTRRKHPLGGNSTIWDNINEERKILTRIKEKATLIIDTSDLTLHELRDIIANKFIDKDEIGKILITLYAFGYKYGIPLDADLVFDVRFLPNPFYIEGLKPLSGKSDRIKEYVLGNEISQKFLKKLNSFIDFLIPKYISENKAYLTIAIGCTGGKHRSVVIVDEILRHLSKKNYSARTIYRDIEKE
ncbi:MAG: RNase adapter RapZ [Candidatus Firestonebacteria bacterium]|nr:RNase adapter RapZ [Candidatus Firestonebacteria bacterium]